MNLWFSGPCQPEGDRAEKVETLPARRHQQFAIIVPTGWTEESAMKVRTCLSAFLFTIFLCTCFNLPRNARAATPPGPAEQASGTQPPSPASVSFTSPPPEDVT